jgi:alkanesulfonate monooxygenase SsuD/methylene tetrahydromethanopterin reductase-like flavin-dependent oxidoreductase (luciferase family)
MPNPPIYAASSAKQGMDQVARYADVWFVGYEPGLDDAPSNIERIARYVEHMRGLSADYGRTLKFGISAHVICAETRKEAVEQARALEAYGARDRISLVAALTLGAVTGKAVTWQRYNRMMVHPFGDAASERHSFGLFSGLPAIELGNSGALVKIYLPVLSRPSTRTRPQPQHNRRLVLRQQFQHGW